MICLDCGFDTDTTDLAAAMAVLGDAEGHVARFVDQLRHPAGTAATDGRDLERVLQLCDALEGARRELLGVPHRESRRDARGPIAMYSALAILGTEASWLQRATRSVSPRSVRPTSSPVVAETAHLLEHVMVRPFGPYSAGETSPLS